MGEAPPALAEGAEVVGEGAELFVAGGGDEEVVFQAQAAAAGPAPPSSTRGRDVAPMV